MVTQSRQTGSNYLRRTQYPYSGSCEGGFPLPLLSGLYTLSKKEVVTSHRGKPIYLDIGDKRMKKYNPFYRRLEEFPRLGQTAWSWCNPPIGWAYYEQLPCYYYQPSQAYSVGNAKGANMPPMSPEDVSSLGENFRDFVIRDMYVKANSPRWNTAKFMAELGETLISIRQLFMGAVKVLLKADEAWRLVKHFSLNSEELWLWYRYALLPAMLDAEELIGALKPPKEVNRVQDGLKEEFELSGSGVSSGWFPNKLDVIWTASGKCRVGCGGAMDILSKHDTSPWGTSAWDVVLGAAEVIPFGFVLNWFLNFEDWLASLRDADVIFAQSYATYAIDIEYEFTPDQGVMDGENHTMHIYQQERIVDVEPPSLPLIDKHWVNLLRTVDAITLTTGILKGILQKRRR